MADLPGKSFGKSYETALKEIRKTASKSQSEKFISKARELGCDEDERSFDKAIKQIITPKKN